MIAYTEDNKCLTLRSHEAKHLTNVCFMTIEKLEKHLMILDDA